MLKINVCVGMYVFCGFGAIMPKYAALSACVSGCIQG